MLFIWLFAQVACMQISLFHLSNSRSQRIVWLFEELQLDYQLHLHQTSADGQISKYPTVHMQAHIFTETSAIAEYFCQLKQQLLIPPDHAEFWNFTFYKNFADASLMPNLALKQIFQQIVHRSPWLLRLIAYGFKWGFNRGYLNLELARQLTQLEQHLQNSAWLAGEQFSYADILLWFPLQAAMFASANTQQYPALQGYLNMIASRPAFQSACLKGQWSTQQFEQYWRITQ